MKILVVGSGGREHTICWKLARSKLVSKIYCAPGNAGIASIGECVPISVEDIPGLVELVKRERIDLTVVGPELPLTLGIVGVVMITLLISIQFIHRFKHSSWNPLPWSERAKRQRKEHINWLKWKCDQIT